MLRLLATGYERFRSGLVSKSWPITRPDRALWLPSPERAGLSPLGTVKRGDASLLYTLSASVPSVFLTAADA